MYDLTNLTSYFDRIVTEHPEDDAAAVGWHTSYAQTVALLSLTALDGFGDGVSVLDLGCGLGAMVEFFAKRAITVRYTGWDISPNMIEGARRRHPGARFEVRDILTAPPGETFDYVIASGLLSYRQIANHGQYVRDMIRAMYGLCDVAVAFNILSGYAFMRSPVLQRNALDLDYGWPDVTYRFCKQLTNHVVIDEASDSRRYDVVMYKRNRAALRRYLEHARPGTTYGPAVKAAIDYHHELGLYDELRAFLLGIEPTKDVWLQLALAYSALGQASAAEDALVKAAAADAGFAEPFVVRGRIALAAHDLGAAIDHFGRALVVDPKHVGARDEIVRALVMAGRRGEARKAAAKLAPGPHADVLQALASDDEAVAETALLRAVAAAPRYLEALVQAALLYERTGRRADALAMWKRAQGVSTVDKSIADRIVSLETVG